MKKLTFLLLILLSLTSCQSVDPVLKIGLVGPFEGPERPIGYDVIYAARLAVREINNAGGVAGYRIALVALDDSSDPSTAAANAHALAADAGVVAVIGNWQPHTTEAALPVFDSYALPFIPMQTGAFAPVPPDQLPEDFHAAYTATTPYGGRAGYHATSAYDGMNFIFAAVESAVNAGDEPSRETLGKVMETLEIDGLVAPVSLP